MAVGDTLPHCDGTGTQADPYIYTTAQGFMECIAVNKSYAQAGEENLVFNANDGVINQSGITIKCTFLNGRGTTILNLMKQNTTGNLIALSYGEYADRHNIEVQNMNFYNMVIIDNNTNNARFASASPDDYTQSFFRNCNFTGVAKGSSFGYNALFYHSNSYSGRSGKNGYINCTFNINLDIGNGGNSNDRILISSDFGAEMTNCTVCVSGKIARPLCIINNLKTNSCTFMNKQTNPLTLVSAVAVRYSANNSDIGYNYIKLYINNASSGTSTLSLSNATKTLVNRSRLTDLSISGTCISMQETDTSALDYIYDAAKLEANGFLVGQVIE